MFKNDLKDFEEASGSKANVDKFEILRVGEWPDQHSDIPKKSLKTILKL